MDTTFFNVGHGEAIFIELKDSKYGIIRDFGRSRSAKKTSHSITPKDIIDLDYCHFQTDYKFDAVLSHAHDDHYNGFSLLYKNQKRDIFENAYIPWFPMKNPDDFGCLMIQYAILLAKYYDVDSETKRNAENWLKAAPVMSTLSKKLWAVRSDYEVPHWGIKNKFLWPNPEIQESQKIKTHEYWSKFKARSNNIDNNFLDEETEAIREVLYPFYQDDVMENKRTYFDQDDPVIALNRIDNILSEPINRDIKRNMRSPLSLSNFNFKPNVDDHSIMFEIGEQGEESLFLSDAHDGAIKKMLEHNNISCRRYKLIKSGHHGNRGSEVLANKRITSQCVINCCGPANSGYYGPSSNYYKVSNNLLCTDWNDNNPDMWADKEFFKIKPQYCIKKPEINS